MKIRGKWVYLYRAVDRDGKTVDFRLSTRRDVTAAKAFFCKAIKVQGAPPRTITLDGYAASHRAVRDMQAGGQLPADTKLRSSKYLNNLIEQDHRGVKLRIGPVSCSNHHDLHISCWYPARYHYDSGGSDAVTGDGRTSCHVHALRSKRAELAGTLTQLEQQLVRQRQI